LLLTGCKEINGNTELPDSANSQEEPAEGEIRKTAPYFNYRLPDFQDGVDYTEEPVHITGIVSDPGASVVVNVILQGSPSVVLLDTIEATINGYNFEADILLKPGRIIIEVMVEKEGITDRRRIVVNVAEDGSVSHLPAPPGFPGQTSTQVWDETTEPALTIDYRWPELQDGIDYTKKPVHISGKVSYPDASVTVYVTTEASSEVPPDAVKATVNGFDFEADVLLKPGGIHVVAMAEREGQTASRHMTVGVTEDGSVTYTSGKSDGSSLPTHSWAVFYIQSDSFINIKAGETRIFNACVATNDGFPSDALPAECSFKTWRSSGANPGPKEPLPEGMTISIEPSSFLAYMYMSYDFTLKIETTGNLAPGLYFIHLQAVPPNLPEWDTRSGLLVIIVEGN